MALPPTYCTHRELKDVFPQVNSFDNKRALYGWVQESSLDDFSGTSNLNVWYTHNTGLVTQLFKDGSEMTNVTSGLDTKKTLVNGAITDIATAAAVDSSSEIEVDDIIRINNEYMKISAIADGTTIAFTNKRHLFGTHTVAHADDSEVYLVLNDSDNDSADRNWFFYDADLDMCVIAIQSDGNPNDLLMEAGEDFSTLITRVTGNASRYLDAKLDPNLPREQFKDRVGNFDYIIVRTAALIAAVFLIRSHDPTSEVATAMMEDAMGNIDALNKGSASLSWQTTGDSSKGIIRDVNYTANTMRPVDTRGRWTGSYDILKVKIINPGSIGIATYSVWAKSGIELGIQNGTQVVTEEIINGDYQPLAGGLQIRFAGGAFAIQAGIDNEWEIEVAGWQEEVDNSAVNSVRMTRR